MKLLASQRESSQSPPAKMKKSWQPNSSNDTERAYSPARPRSDLSNIRGRISGPIPIASTANEDFAVRDSDNGSAVISGQGESGQSSNSPSSQRQAKGAMLVTDSTDSQGHQPLHTRSQSSPMSSTGLRPTAGQKQSTPPPIRQSTFSMGTNSSSKNVPQRKKSTLRGAIEKLFGRRRKGTTQAQATSQPEDSSRPSPESWAQHHRSTTLTTPIAEDPAGEQRRSTPFTHDDYGRALRSHTVDAEDRMAIERSRTLVHLDSNFSRRRPGGSSTLSNGEHRGVSGELGGLTPRPASVHARLSSQGFANENPEEIGRAITSDCSGLKRRSRSLSAITDKGRGNPVILRSRGSEIRYWRSSYDPEYKSPVASSFRTEGEDHGAVSVNETAKVSGNETVPDSPVQPFSFGDPASMNHLVGMKITQAATMEARLGSLEERVRGLEEEFAERGNAVAGYRSQSHSQDLTKPRSIGNAPPVSYKPNPGSKWPANQGPDDGLYSSSRPSTGSSDAFVQSSADYQVQTQLSIGRQSRLQPPISPNSNRPLSTATVRGATSLPSLTQELSRPLTVEHYTTLMALLDTERAARQALEAQVKTLGYQLSIMAKSSKTKRISKEKSAFDFDDDAEEDTSKELSSKQHVGVHDSSISTWVRDDDDKDDNDSLTSYATWADEEADMGGQGYNKATRTLSLSQLALNRPVAKSAEEPLPNMI